MPPSMNFLDGLFGLRGQVAIVTGGSGRLGSRYVSALADAGASVAAFDLPGRAHPGLDALVAAKRPVSTYDVDVTNRAAVDAAIAAVAKQFGTPTVLVNNAGLGSSPADAALETGPFEQYPERAWHAMIDSHLTSTLLVSQSFMAAFKRARTSWPELAGSIINVSSTYGVVTPDQSLYDFKRRDGAEYYKP